MLLTGQATAYIYPTKGTKKWDTCALHALVVAHGGRVTDGFGDEIEYWPDAPHENATGIVATFGCIHARCVFSKPTAPKQ